MVNDWGKQLDAIAERASFAEGEIRNHRFRHTYTAARLQTSDQGVPISVFTFSRELGHTSTKLVEQVYSHLGDVRHRSEVIEYRIGQHRMELVERLRLLRASD